jgi:hypothetical protein
LATAEGREEANKAAVESGAYKADELKRETGAFAGATEGKAKKLEDKDFGEYEEEV